MGLFRKKVNRDIANISQVKKVGKNAKILSSEMSPYAATWLSERAAPALLAYEKDIRNHMIREMAERKRGAKGSIRIALAATKAIRSSHPEKNVLSIAKKALDALARKKKRPIKKGNPFGNS